MSRPVIEHPDVADDDLTHMTTRELLVGSVQKLHLTFRGIPRGFHRGVIESVTGRAETRRGVPVDQSVHELEATLFTRRQDPEN